MSTYRRCMGIWNGRHYPQQLFVSIHTIYHLHIIHLSDVFLCKAYGDCSMQECYHAATYNTGPCCKWHEHIIRPVGSIEACANAAISIWTLHSQLFCGVHWQQHWCPQEMGTPTETEWVGFVNKLWKEEEKKVYDNMMLMLKIKTEKDEGSTLPPASILFGRVRWERKGRNTNNAFTNITIELTIQYPV